MKLLNVIQRYPPAIGGSELWCQEICRDFTARGHEVRVATLDVDQEEEYWKEPLDGPRRLALGRWMLDGPIEVRRYHRSLPLYWLYHLVYRGLLDGIGRVYFYGPHSLEMYASFRRDMAWADVVMLHTLPHPHNLVAFAAARRLGKPVMSIPYFHPGHPYYERSIHYAFLRRCDAVVALTSFEADHLRAHGVAPDRIVTTGTGIHPEEYAPGDREAFRRRLAERYGVRDEDRIVTFLGRKIEEKGIDHLVAAVRALVDEMPIRLFLLGPRFAWYDRLYASLSARDRERIVDTGSVSHRDKVDFLQASDLLVLPSRYESFGIVFLEAWLCGAAVVGSAAGAVPSVVEDCGFLCPPDAPEALRDTIREALSDRARARALAARGKQRVLERYTWPRIGDAVERSLRDVTARRGIRRRVLVCSNAYPPNAIGGAEVIAHEHAKRVAARGYEVRVFAGELDATRPRFEARLDRHEGLAVERVALRPEDYSWEFFNFTAAEVEEHFERTLDAYAPEIVHFHNVIGLSAGLLAAARRRGAKTIVTLHDYWGICFKNTLLKTRDGACADVSRCHECMATIPYGRWSGVPVRLRRDFVRQALGNAGVLIAPSAALAARYAQTAAAPGTLRVLGYGADVGRFAGIERTTDAERVRFVFVGYLGAHKGIGVLIDALTRLADRGDWSLEIVGAGELREPCEQRVRARGLGDRVRFRGSLDNRRVAEVYARSDVLVLPSVWPENQPVSILEAMAAGLTVVASAIGGIPELVEHGATGLVFPPGDAEALASCLARLVDDRAILAELGGNALRRVSAMSIETTIDALVALYEEPHRIAEPPDDGAWTVACAARSFDPRCAEAIDAIDGEAPALRFVLVDWLDEGALARAKLLWIVDPEIDLPELVPHLHRGLPLLVPQENEALRSFCVARGAGLYYADATEAVTVIRHLTAHEDVRAALGAAARAAVYDDPRLHGAGAGR